MKTVSIDMNQSNYVRVGNTHIFVNFDNVNFRHLMELNPKSIDTVHIYITDFESISSNLRTLIERFGKSVKIESTRPIKVENVEISCGHKRKFTCDDEVIPYTKIKRDTKIILHIPKYGNSFIKSEINDVIGNIGEYKVFTYDNKKPTLINVFAIYIKDVGNSDYVHIVHWNDYNGIKAHIGIHLIEPGDKITHKSVDIKFPYFFYQMGECDKGIFNNPLMKANPEEFKNTLIEQFKLKCPPDILTSYKDDDDIWDCIMQQGEWKIK